MTLMSGFLRFIRFDRSSKVEGFVYNTTQNTKDMDYDFQTVSMEKPGFTIHTVVQNYMSEAVLLGGNLTVTPTHIKSLRQGHERTRDDFNNVVIITIYSSENNTAIDPKKRTTHRSKTEIRIPGKMLNQGSVFINELDCYLMTESHVDATRSLIAKDINQSGWDSINIPASMIKQDPAVIYVEYKQLAKFCIERQDKINIRIGVDLQYGKIPDNIKSLHVAILDNYFVPYSCYKLVYDPTLTEDEFVIENLHLASRDEFRSTFSELRKVGTMYLDHDEQKTLFGNFYGMALFTDSNHYLTYVHKRKTQERFRDETLYVADRSGDPRLKEEVVRLEREILSLKDVNNEKDGTITSLRDSNRKLKTDIRDREETINKIRQHYDEKMSSEAVLKDIENEAFRLGIDSRKIDNDRIELDQREKAAPLIHKANMLKTMADILKSSWGITTACIGGIISIAALCKKYNIKLTMGT